MVQAPYLIINRRKVTITHPEKVLFGKSGITKGQMIAYYERIAPIILPHIKNRPISMQRFPAGILHEGFYQKDAGDYFPTWIKRYTIAREDREKIVHHVVCNDAQTLVYLANQAVITPHIWLSTVKDIQKPDYMIFDLDPSQGCSFSTVAFVAKRCKDFLQELGLHPFLKTTGSRGLHVTVPIRPTILFDDVRTIARAIAQELVNAYPEQATLNMRLDKRDGKVFIDYLRNAWAQTAVAPYALRAREDAPIATPIEWKELTSTMHPQKYTLSNIFKRVSRKSDIWQDIRAYTVCLKSIKM